MAQHVVKIEAVIVVDDKADILNEDFVCHQPRKYLYLSLADLLSSAIERGFDEEHGLYYRVEDLVLERIDGAYVVE